MSRLNRVKVKLLNLGLTKYEFAHKIMKNKENEQLEYLKKNIALQKTLNNLIVTTHHPVYTVGTRTDEYKKFNYEKFLNNLGADFVYTDRGGLITFHGPGQLILYPILNLQDFNLTPREYVNSLEQCIIDTCLDFNVNCSRDKDIGVWVGNNKIGAVGIHVTQRIVTSHGIAINCNVNLKWFDHIVPCGLADKGTTSLSQELGHVVSPENITPIILGKFKKIFNADLV